MLKHWKTKIKIIFLLFPLVKNKLVPLAKGKSQLCRNLPVKISVLTPVTCNPPEVKHSEAWYFSSCQWKNTNILCSENYDIEVYVFPKMKIMFSERSLQSHFHQRTLKSFFICTIVNWDLIFKFCLTNVTYLGKELNWVQHSHALLPSF